MTMSERTLPGVAIPAGQTIWRSELLATVKLALPMALTQLGQIAMMTTDLALLGRLGDRVVAATALAHTVLFGAFVIGMGLVSAVAPLAAQAFGAREPRLVRRAAGRAVGCDPARGSSELCPALRRRASGRARAGSGDGWPRRNLLAEPRLEPRSRLVVHRAARLHGRGQPAGAGLWITVAAIPANLVLAYALIYGAFGAPRLELFGAGLATTIVDIGMCAASIWVAYACPPFKKYRILGRFWRADWPLFGRLLVLGTPISGLFMLEYGVFAAAALLMGHIGTVELAAHQIAMTAASIMFMIPFGISQAATVRVGHAVGRRDAPATRRAGFAALALSAAFMAIMTLAVMLAREFVPLVFLGGSTANAAATAALAATLLVVGASFFIADGVQTVAGGALRGLNDTRMPMLFAAICFWGIGFTACYALGFWLGWGAVGIWIALSFALMIYAFLLVWRFDALTRKGHLPEIAGAG